MTFHFTIIICLIGCCESPTGHICSSLPEIPASATWRREGGGAEHLKHAASKRIGPSRLHGYGRLRSCLLPLRRGRLGSQLRRHSSALLFVVSFPPRATHSLCHTRSVNSSYAIRPFLLSAVDTKYSPPTPPPHPLCAPVVS